MLASSLMDTVIEILGHNPKIHICNCVEMKTALHSALSYTSKIGTAYYTCKVK